MWTVLESHRRGHTSLLLYPDVWLGETPDGHSFYMDRCFCDCPAEPTTGTCMRGLRNGGGEARAA